jgi:hypothetical protein
MTDQKGIVGILDERKRTCARVSGAICLAAFVITLTFGCAGANGPFSSERAIDDVTSFFTGRARFGMSPDAGLCKYSDLLGQWDHVATFHGMADDVGLCESTVRALRETHPQERYTCRLLNR